MSTFLQLCAKLRQETTDSGTGPTTVVGQTGELARFVSWVCDSYTELQQDRDDWLFLRKSFTVNTVAGTGEYAYGACTDTATSALISRFSRWYRDTLRCYLSSAGVASEYRLIPLEWDVFRRLYRSGPQTDGQPVYVSFDPTDRIALGPEPSAVYVVTGDCQKGPQTLALDADEPEMPSRFHNLIVYEAMIRYGFNRVAPEALQFAQAEGSRLRGALELSQLPRMSVGEPLA